MRLGDRLLGDVQVRACMLDSRAAVVGLSRPDPSSWGSLGSGWMPPRDEARWTPLPAGERPLPKSFRVQGQLHGLALFLAASAEPPSASGARSVGAVAAAKLFRLDTPAPVAAVEWQGLETEGRWVEIAFEGGPLAAGDYVLELRALRGAPAWLGWNRVPERIAGSDLTTVVETLLVRQSPPEARYDQPIPVRLRVVGRADPIERLKGAEATPKSEPARYEDYEMVFEAQLLPGETEILFLNDYRP
jgi:hypothetical protein